MEIKLQFSKEKMIYLTSIETAKKYGAPVNVINLPEIIGKGYKKFWKEDIQDVKDPEVARKVVLRL